ncbi:hypothetical protein [Chryseobacterium sp. MFBS3-17]|uniref:hypothetical protein n=1 Tax=Chryseobacterium sp. MFBS3-17 TaxID=2886689 RepID=UPI001D0E91F7|nr:hypothetical protein [Chryseobacterium sp. MFBS3-17]MCC2590767.1 hypothetical protein [Chryseobacterium sp. MFBS3-17]
MIIENSYLAEYGAERIFYETGDYIFREHQNPKYYIQILSGIVKMNNYDEEGAEGDHPAFNPFAKTAYYKVLKEETDLHTLLGKISSMRSDEPDTFGILNNKNYGIPK